MMSPESSKGNHICPVCSFSEVGNPMYYSLMISYWCVLLSCSTSTSKNTLSSCAVSVECMCFCAGCVLRTEAWM